MRKYGQNFLISSHQPEPDQASLSHKQLSMSPQSSLFFSNERRHILQTAGSLLLGCSLEIGHAQTAWPNKPIRLVLPSGPGGGADIFGRPLAE